MRLPPLNAIKAFEATARCGGFTAAAVKLGVSSAAVSLQVAKAEAFLGKKLFVRGNNSLTLTDAGRMLYPQVAQALTQLSEVTERFLEQDMRSRIVISTIQSLADRWVAPAVVQLRRDFPEIGVSIQIDPDPFDPRRNVTDLRLSFRSVQGDGLVSRLVLQDYVAPVSAPGQFDDLTQVDDMHLIHVDWGEAYSSYPTWSAWFRQFDSARLPDGSKGLRAAGTGLGIELAIQCAGVLLAPLHLARRDLAEGRLVQLGQDRMRLPYGYHAIQPDPGGPQAKQAYVRSLLTHLVHDDSLRKS